MASPALSMHAPEHLQPGTGTPLPPLSSNTLAARDAQHILASLLASQEANSGTLYLRSTAVPPSIRDTIKAGDRPFCLAGHAQVVSKDFADGPGVLLQFTVPEELASQTLAFSEKEQEFEAVQDQPRFGSFTVELGAQETDQCVLQAPSPLCAAINVALPPQAS